MADDRFGPYVVFERLGAGGMATVHRATIELEDDEMREVALKRLLPQFADDKRFVDDLIREGKLAAVLEHPNIVRILELGRIGRTYFIAMDLVRGEPLASILQKAQARGLKTPIAIALALMAQMLDALDHAHSSQIVHRDLTPSNLIVTRDGLIKIIDFGVAKALAGNLQTSSGLAKGKLGYMSLEASVGKNVDTRTDIFSAGVVMWELVSVRKLFQGDSDLDLLHAIRTQRIEPPSHHNADCPRELDEVILRALARTPDERPATAGDMIDVVEALRREHYATGRDVASWVARVMADAGTADDEPEIEIAADDDSPEIEITRDLSDNAAGDDFGAEGTELGTQLSDDSQPPMNTELSDDTQPPTPDLADDTLPPTPGSRFIESDTEVSVSMYGTRKQ